MANDTPTPEQPVDLVSAGAVPQQAKSMSMADVLEAMRPTGGGIPPEVLMAMQQQSAPNPWMAAASGMAAGGRSNPYLAQTQQGQASNISLINALSQMQHRQQTEAISRATLMNTLREQEQKRTDLVSDTRRKIEQATIAQMEASPSLDTRKAAAARKADLLERSGIKGFTPDMLLQQMELGPEKLKDMRVMARMQNPDGTDRFSDAEIAAEFPALQQPGMRSLIQRTRAMMRDPQAQADLGFKSQAEIKAKEAQYGADYVSALLTKWQKENPQVLAEQLPYVAEYARQQHRNLTDLNMSVPADAAIIGHGQIFADARINARKMAEPAEVRAWTELRMKQVMHEIDIQAKRLTMGKTVAETAKINAEIDRIKDEVANGKPLSAEAVKMVRDTNVMRNSAARIMVMHDKPETKAVIDANLGPWQTGLNRLAAATRFKTGTVAPEIIAAEQEIGNLVGFIRRLQSGLNVTAIEQENLKNTIPHVTEHPDMFWQKAHGLMRMAKELEDTTMTLVLKNNRGAVLAAMELGLIPGQGPLPGLPGPVTAGATSGPLKAPGRVTVTSTAALDALGNTRDKINAAIEAAKAGGWR